MNQSHVSDLDPRAQRTRSAALDAAWALLRDEGPDAVTHLRVAERTGIGRNTLYRHWKEREKLLLETLATRDLSAPVVSTGLLRERLIADMTYFMDTLHSSFAPVFATLIERSEWSLETRALKRSFSERISMNTKAVLQNAIEEGQLPATLDVELASEQLIGPIFFRRFATDNPVTLAIVEQVVDGFLAAYWQGKMTE